MRTLVLIALVAALSTVSSPPTPAAVPGERLSGHRCRTYEPAVTNEDTVSALVDTSAVPGAWCEIDLKRLSDGTVIVWHDPTWSRVADAGTLPAGVAPTDNVGKATWAQVSQIRTKGGAPVARFTDMLDASAEHQVPLLVEVVNGVLRDPAYWIGYASSVGAEVRYYQSVSSTCTTDQLDALRAAGAVIGIKTTSVAKCKLTSQQIQDKGATFIADDASAITADYMTDMASHGIAVLARGATQETAKALLDAGVERLMVERPRVAADWDIDPPAPIAGDQLLGHRCRTYAPEVTNENTVAALVDTAGVPGAWCEVDVWKLSDGTMIVWDDSTWGRVADPSTLPDGITATSKVATATWTQVSQIRTKGGEPVATLADMITASAVHDVPLVVEVRNNISDPSSWVGYAGTAGATVRYYQLPTGAACTAGAVDRLRSAGAAVGFKMPAATSSCQLSPADAQARGATFVASMAKQVTSAYTGGMHSLGIEVYATNVTRSNARTLLANGADRLLVERPADSVAW